MTEPGGAEFTGPGLRGLRPRPGDQVLIDHRTVSWLAAEHWMRVTLVADPYAVPLELAGYVLPREDLGERGAPVVLTVLIAAPAELVVRRPAGAAPLEARPPVAGRLPGPVEQLLAQPERRDLPASVLDALARPDQHRQGETGVWRWP